MSPSEKLLVIQVTTAEGQIVNEMLDVENSKMLPDGVTLKSGGGTINETLGFAQDYRFLAYFAENVVQPLAVGLLSAYIYDRLKSKPDATLRIGKVDVRIDKGEIQRIILEKLELTEVRRNEAD